MVSDAYTTRVASDLVKKRGDLERSNRKEPKEIKRNPSKENGASGGLNSPRRPTERSRPLAERAERPREPQPSCSLRAGQRPPPASRTTAARPLSGGRARRRGAHRGAGAALRRTLQVAGHRPFWLGRRRVTEENGGGERWNEARVPASVGAGVFCSREKTAPPSDGKERPRSRRATVGFFRPRRERRFTARAQVVLARLREACSAAPWTNRVRAASILREPPRWNGAA
jgi:hypothetical protein